jgi:hypothetical protein
LALAAVPVALFYGAIFVVSHFLGNAIYPLAMAKAFFF